MALRLASKNKPEESSGETAKDSSSPKRHIKESTLAFYLANNYNKSGWEALHKDCKNRTDAIYPSYYTIRQAQRVCKPDNYFNNETEMRVPLQSLLNKTAERLVTALQAKDPNSIF